jgi:hypothetical protein
VLFGSKDSEAVVLHHTHQGGAYEHLYTKALGDRDSDGIAARKPVKPPSLEPRGADKLLHTQVVLTLQEPLATSDRL